jgi:hypothetical protein
MNATLSGLATGVDVDIFDEIRSLHQYEVVVEFRGVWRKGMQYSSLDQAVDCARDAWGRSRLKTQVRGPEGVVFAKYPEE